MIKWRDDNSFRISPVSCDVRIYGLNLGEAHKLGMDLGAEELGVRQGDFHMGKGSTGTSWF